MWTGCELGCCANLGSPDQWRPPPPHWSHWGLPSWCGPVSRPTRRPAQGCGGSLGRWRSPGCWAAGCTRSDVVKPDGCQCGWQTAAQALGLKVDERQLWTEIRQIKVENNTVRRHRWSESLTATKVKRVRTGSQQQALISLEEKFWVLTASWQMVLTWV